MSTKISYHLHINLKKTLKIVIYVLFGNLAYTRVLKSIAFAHKIELNLHDYGK